MVSAYFMVLNYGNGGILLLKIVVNGIVFLLVMVKKPSLASIFLISNCINRDYSTVNYHKWNRYALCNTNFFK